ncbi:MAG: NAD(P)H-quinone oxidoreductase [Phyllobacteriaceae bacterium]|nr:NAD(P)H-quinone oxidoreductase [Phyllobacteriaceae bacterium]
MAEMMEAILAHAPGGPEVLELGSVERPVAAAGELLIEVHASGLNGADLAQRQGSYPPPKGASEILGLEASGVVAAVGEGVSGFATGDRVCALLTGGGYARYCAVPAVQAARLPSGVDFIQGTSLLETLCTVWLNVFEIGQLKTDESLLVHGGTSGIGTAAIQLATLAGAKVWSTTGSAEKVKLCLESGAEQAINYHEADFAEVIRESGEAMDVVLDIVGGDYFEQNLRCMGTHGRMIVIAIKGGRYGKIDLGRLLMRNLSVQGSTLRSKPVAEKAALVSAVQQRVWPMIADGSYRIIVDSVYPASKAAEAHRHMESGRHMGKIVLNWD